MSGPSRRGTRRRWPRPSPAGRAPRRARVPAACRPVSRRPASSASVVSAAKSATSEAARYELGEGRRCRRHGGDPRGERPVDGLGSAPARRQAPRPSSLDSLAPVPRDQHLADVADRQHHDEPRTARARGSARASRTTVLVVGEDQSCRSTAAARATLSAGVRLVARPACRRPGARGTPVSIASAMRCFTSSGTVLATSGRRSPRAARPRSRSPRRRAGTRRGAGVIAPAAPAVSSPSR